MFVLIENKEMSGYRRDLPGRQRKSGNANDFFITKGKETTRGSKLSRMQHEREGIETRFMNQAEEGLRKQTAANEQRLSRQNKRNNR